MRVMKVWLIDLRRKLEWKKAWTILITSVLTVSKILGRRKQECHLVQELCEDLVERLLL